MWAGIIGSFAAGVGVTPLLEYLWHAHLAHGRRADPSRDTHLKHHREAYTVPPPWQEILETLPRLAIVLAVIGVSTGLALGVGPGVALSAGLFTGYVLIQLLHARMHVRPPRTRSEEWMWRFHWHHHAVDARVNHGLTNPLFDFVFRTAFVPAEVNIPERLAPPWLKDAGAIGGLRVASAGGAPRSPRAPR